MDQRYGANAVVAVMAHRAQVAPRLGVAAMAGVATLVGLALRLGRRSGVTDDDLRRPLPGDNLIRNPQLITDRGATIRAPVDEVWPWLVQMGYHRGGWYTNRRLDRLIWHIDNPSEDRIVPELQQLAVGDVVPDGPPGTARFRVAMLEPNGAIVYLDDEGTHIPGVAFSWAFVLDPIDERTTRVQVRTRATYRPRLVVTLLGRLVIGPSDCVMIGQTLRGIKRRAEQATKAAAETPRPGACQAP